MNNSVQIIPFANLMIAFIPVLAIIGILFKWSLNSNNALYAVARMLIQLILIGYFLTHILIFANSMNSISLAAERLNAEIERDVAYDQARKIALQASLIPIVNSLFAVGLVSLPGMMTGQILSGISPLVAVQYQIVVMCMIFGASGMAATIYLVLAKRRS